MRRHISALLVQQRDGALRAFCVFRLQVRSRFSVIEARQIAGKGNRNQFETEEECKHFCVPGYKHNAAICEAKRRARALVERSHAAILVPNHQLINAVETDESHDDGGPSVDCITSEWSSWGACSVTCGRGKRTRNRSIQVCSGGGLQTAVCCRVCRATAATVARPPSISFKSATVSSGHAVGRRLSPHVRAQTDASNVCSSLFVSRRPMERLGAVQRAVWRRRSDASSPHSSLRNARRRRSLVFRFRIGAARMSNAALSPSMSVNIFVQQVAACVKDKK